MKMLAVIVTLFGLAQCTQIEWTADEFPNPRTSPAECGRHPNRPSYVCDPNNIITTKYADFLDHLLLTLPNDTNCPCSAKSCEDREHSKGYIIAVALVRRLKLTEGVADTWEGKEGVARTFLFNLMKYRWNTWGTCDEVTIILYSKDDRMLMTLAGTTPRRKLTDGISHEIQSELGRFFRPDGNIGQGLHYLTVNYIRVLDGLPHRPIMYSQEPISGSTVLTVSIITSILTTVFVRIFC